MSAGEVYQVMGDTNGYFLVSLLADSPQRITARILQGKATKRREVLVKKLVERSFGADETLLNFYRFARRDSMLARLTKKYRGVRLVGMADLWECLLWAIIGQQISVAAAFSVRSRLARRTGAVVSWKGIEFEGFPTPQDLTSLSVAQIHQCGFTRQKADYARDIAKLFISGAISDAQITSLPFAEARKRLLALRGIGPWSAEYAMMRAALDPDACPVEDIGLRNAIGKAYGLGRQATVQQTTSICEAWRPFRAFATFYLWQTLV